MDPFEDFEFKPLTEGLGFHKKAEKIKHDIKSSSLVQEKTPRAIPEPSKSLIANTEIETSVVARETAPRPASQSINDLIASLPPSLDFMEEKPESPKSNSSGSLFSSSLSSAATEKSSFDLDANDTFGGRPQIFHPIGREEYKAPASPTIGSFLPTPGTKAGGALTPPVPTIPAPTAKAPTPSSPYRERMDESFARAFPHVEKSKREHLNEGADEQLQPISSHMGAGLLDGMVVAGISTLLLVCILAITRINLIGMLSNAKTDLPTQIHLSLLFLAVLQMYMLVSRAFAGSSLGEWAFDLQLGSPEQQKSMVFPLQVAWRTLLITLTGIVLLPLFSFISRRDLVKYLTGLQLFRRP